MYLVTPCQLGQGLIAPKGLKRHFRLEGRRKIRADWALAQYQSCRRILARELGVEPMPETRRLHRQILEGDGAALTAKRAARRGE